MTDLMALLREYAEPIEVMAGADDSEKPPPPPTNRFNAKQLRADLERIRRSQGVWFSVCISAALIVAAGALLLALWQVGKPSVPVTAGVGGVSGCMVALTFAARLLKRRAQTDLLIALAGMMDPDTLQTIVAALVRSMA